MSSQIALTPTAVNKYLKAVLEQDNHLKLLKVKGEISNLKYHSNGNIYFSVKDENAQLSCIMFNQYTRKLKDKFEEGDKIELDASLYLYVKSGSYNLNVYNMKKEGQGDLTKKFNELKLKLQNEGLFDNSHKKEIPLFPTKIGVVTAKTGAAIQDILITLKNRYPIAKVTVYSVSVQGIKATNDIVKKLKYSDNDNNSVIIVGRGGGSIEDLWAFNEEAVARAIYNLKTPVISSVGHEVDFTISDFVADVRAATPTAAAQITTPDLSNIKSNISNNMSIIINNLNTKINHSEFKLNTLVNNQYFVNPLTKINLNFDQVSVKFNSIISTQQAKLNHKSSQVDNLSYKLVDLEKSYIKNLSSKLSKIHDDLDNLNPLSILSRGYSVTYLQDKALSSVDNLNVSDSIITKLKDGEIESTITNIKGDT